MIKTGLKFLPTVPNQKRLNWLANYIDSKNDPLYDLIFSYQLIDAYLRGLVFYKTKDYRLTDKFGLKSVIKEFIKCYPKKKNLGDRIKSWADQRDTVVHHLISSTKVTNPRKIDLLIKRICKNGKRLFLKLKSVNHKKFESQTPLFILSLGCGDGFSEECDVVFSGVN